MYKLGSPLGPSNGATIRMRGEGEVVVKRSTTRTVQSTRLATKKVRFHELHSNKNKMRPMKPCHESAIDIERCWIFWTAAVDLLQILVAAVEYRRLCNLINRVVWIYRGIRLRNASLSTPEDPRNVILLIGC